MCVCVRNALLRELEILQLLDRSDIAPSLCPTLDRSRNYYIADVTIRKHSRAFPFGRYYDFGG